MQCIMRVGFVVGALAIIAQTASAQPARNPGSDWPCPQILVHQISLPAVWAGPPIDGAKWQDDPAIVDLTDKLAPRRTPVDEAEHEIDAFAKAAGTDKKAKLTMLFAGLFDKLNSERSQVITGLDRFGHKQKELADKVRAENAGIQALPDKAEDPQQRTNEQKALEWDMRIFEDRRHTLTYVCETPTLIEQRLFALARAIQADLD